MDPMPESMLAKARREAHEAINDLYRMHPPCDKPVYGCPHVVMARAAIAVLEAAAQMMGRLEQAEKMCQISDDASGAEEAQDAQRKERDYLRHIHENEK